MKRRSFGISLTAAMVAPWQVLKGIGKKSVRTLIIDNYLASHLLRDQMLYGISAYKTTFDGDSVEIERVDPKDFLA